MWQMIIMIKTLAFALDAVEQKSFVERHLAATRSPEAIPILANTA